MNDDTRAEQEIQDSLSEAERALVAQVEALTSQLATARESRAALITKVREVAVKYATHRDWCVVADEALAEIDPELASPHEVHMVTVTMKLCLPLRRTVSGRSAKDLLTSDGTASLVWIRSASYDALCALVDCEQDSRLVSAEITDHVYLAGRDGITPTGVPILSVRRTRDEDHDYEYDGEMATELLPLI